MTEINKKLDLAAIPPTNNDGDPYILPLDIYKEGYQAYNISNWFKGRVGDNGTPFAIRWYSHGRLLNIHGMRPFIEGQVGDYTIDDSDPDNVRIDMAEDASNIHIVGDVDDSKDGGVAIYRLISQAFPKSGIFYGKIGFMGTQDDGTLVNTGVDIVFKVLAGHMNMLGARKFYVTELEKAWLDMQDNIKQYNQEYKDATVKQVEQFKEDTENALADLNTKIANEIKRAEDTLGDTQASIDSNISALKRIAATCASIQAEIIANDVITKPDYDKLMKQIMNSLSAMKPVPVAFKSITDLKAKYPTGSAGMFVTVDTGHLWIYQDQWVDCGSYQSAGIIYKPGLTNNVGFTLISHEDVIVGNVFDEKKWTNDIFVKVPAEFYVYTLADDGSGNWKYTLLQNDKTEYILKKYQYICADIDNKTLIVVYDNQIQQLAKNRNFLILGYNNNGNFTGPWLPFIKKQQQRITEEFNQDFVEISDVIISSDPESNYGLKASWDSDYALVFSAKKYQYSNFIVDTYKLTNKLRSLNVPNYGILVFDLKNNMLAVTDYALIKNDIDSQYIVLGYNNNGSLVGMWSKYQDVNHFNSKIGNLYPESNNSISIYASGTNLQISWKTSNFNYTPVFAGSNKNFFVIPVKLQNSFQTISLSDGQFLIFNTSAKTIEVHTKDYLSQLTFSYILLGFNSGGKFIGKWSGFSQSAVSETTEIPNYYHANGYIEKKVAKINANNDFTNGVSFFWITDPHLKSNAFQSPKLLSYLQEQTGINLTFCGGDIPVAYGNQQDVEWAAKEFTSKFNHATDNFFTVRGNHDFTVKKSAKENIGFTESDAWTYNVLQRNNELKLHNVPGKEYWYVDNEVQKTRYIGLDTTPVSDTSNNTSWGVKFIPDTSQSAWLVDVLNNLPKNYRVITFSHLPLSSKLQYSDDSVQYLNQILIAFANHRKAEINVGTSTVNVDFTRTTGKFIASFSGHTHLDEDGVDDGTLQINTSCDAMYNDDPKYTVTRQKNTINEQCFDVVSIDFDKQSVKCVRIGAGYSEERNYKIPAVEIMQPESAD